jgi:hypothetical protein
MLIESRTPTDMKEIAGLQRRFHASRRSAADQSEMPTVAVRQHFRNRAALAVRANR